MEKYNLQKLVLIPLSLTFLVLITTFILTSYHISQRDEIAFMANKHHQLRSIFTELSVRDSKAMLSAAEIIADRVRFQQAMRDKDLSALETHGHEAFLQLKRTLQIDQLYFRDPQGNVLVRAYRPDDMSPGRKRVSLQRATETGLPTSGLELGRMGILAQRLVYPWFIEGEMVGLIELGTELQRTIYQIKEMIDVDIMIVIEKKHLDEQTWAADSEHLQNYKDWNLLSDSVISENTLNLPVANLVDIFKTATSSPKQPTAQINESQYRLGQFPLIDSGYQQIGTLLMIVDVTERTDLFRAFMLRTTIFSLFTSLALFIFAFKILGRAGRQLNASTDQLLEQSQHLEQNNNQLTKEIFERQKTQQQLQELNEHLEHRVSERTRELADKNNELEASRKSLEAAFHELKAKQATILHQDKMACIGQLAAGVAHDINNPIGFVSHNIKTLDRYYERLNQFLALNIEMIKRRGDTELMAACIKGRDDFGIEKILQEIPVMLAECHDGTTRISQTVQSLRTFSRSEIPKHELTDIHQCLDSTLAIIRHELRDKITVERNYGNIPKRYCYTGQINQVLLNLLINATQAISDQGIIRIDTWAENEHIYISINDNGCGIPQAVLKRIFEPFFTTKEAGVGTGLGMSIVLDIITKHKGVIDVTSQEGVGTTVVVCMPFDERSRPRDSSGMMAAMEQERISP